MQRSLTGPLSWRRFGTTDDSTVPTADAALLQCFLHADHRAAAWPRIGRPIVDHLVQRIAGRCGGFEVERLLLGREVVFERVHRGQRKFGGTFADQIQIVRALGQMKRWPVRRCGWLKHRLAVPADRLHASRP